jgi:23S rRNA (uracil1939-C5)-methyltransferase
MKQYLGQTLELSVEKPALGGAGLAKHQGLVVFVQGGLPGSKVLARVVKAESNCLHAEVEQVQSPSPQAVVPDCAHFGPCGGCLWRNAAYPAQLAWKRAMVQEQLARLAGCAVVVGETVASPLQLGYRNKMEFAFGPGPKLGLRRSDRPQEILEVESCLLMPEPAMAMLAAVRDLAKASGLLAYSARTGHGAWRHAVLRRGQSTGQWLIQLIVGPKADAGRIKPLAEELLRDFPQLTGVVLGVRRDRGDFALAETRAWTLGQGYLQETLAGLSFRISAESFFQVNTQGAELLYAEALRLAGLTGRESVWDLYCGVGGLSLLLAGQAKTVTGFEITGQAVGDAKKNATTNKLDNCRFVAGDLKDSLGKETTKPDVVVLDPPRSGLHPEVADRLMALAPERMVYVSCNPATLARDLKRLGQAYQVEAAMPVDLFPHSAHVECVARLERKR